MTAKPNTPPQLACLNPAPEDHAEADDLEHDGHDAQDRSRQDRLREGAAGSDGPVPGPETVGQQEWSEDGWE